MNKRSMACAIEKGDVLKVDRKTYRVETTYELLDRTRAPETWPDHLKFKAHVLDVWDLTDNAKYEMIVPSILGRSCTVIATADDEGHWPVCGSCGEAWPCEHSETLWESRMSADAVIRQVTREFEYPHSCKWHERFNSFQKKRYKTERGMKRHVSKCDANPATWNFEVWIPIFDDSLKVVGGFRPNGSFMRDGAALGFKQLESEDDYLRIANEVRVRALDGTLPDTADGLVAPMNWV